MKGLTVCILSDGDWLLAARAAASAARFGLPVVVGVAGGGERGTPPIDVTRHRLTWRDDFADARNQLLDRVAAPWLLWLDADEEIVSLALPDAPAAGADVFGVWIEDRADLTPRPIVRLHARAPGVRWLGAIHEMLTAASDGDPPILDGCLIRHHGYADPAVVARKRRRNHAIAVRALARGERDYGLVLERARGEGTFAAWLAAFNHADARPLEPGGVDRRVEAAEALCALGYTTPATLVLRDDPGIVPLRLALLKAAEQPDEAALALLATDLAGGRYDRRYAMPAALARADTETLWRWLRR